MRRDEEMRDSHSFSLYYYIGKKEKHDRETTQHLPFVSTCSPSSLL